MSPTPSPRLFKVPRVGKRRKKNKIRIVTLERRVEMWWREDFIGKVDFHARLLFFATYRKDGQMLHYLQPSSNLYYKVFPVG